MTIAFNGMLFDRALICASCGAAVAAVIVAALALVVSRFVRGRSAPLRYGLLLAALVVLGIVPAVAAASRLGGWGALRVSPSAVDRPLATRPLIASPEMLRPSLSLPPVPTPTQVVAAAADDHFIQPEQTPHHEKTAAAPLRMPTLREAASGLLWAWLGGLLFFVGMVFRDLGRLKRLRQTLVPCSSPAAVALLGEAARSVGLAQPPRLFESAAVPVPVVIGPVNPVVVLPAGMANTLDREKLTAILLHEAAHVVHGDLWVGLLQHAVAAIFWWCPPVHRLNRRLAEVREEICDDYVVLAQGDGFQLAEVLVEMAAGLQGRGQRLTIGPLGAIDEKPALEGRVERLIDLTRKAAPMTRMNRLAVVAGGAFGLVALAIVLATTIHAADEVADPSAIIAGIRENISAFKAFRCRYRYTVGVVPVARDGVNGPYYRRSADGLNVADRAEPCTEISWLRNGDVQLLEARLLDRNLVQELRAGKQTSSGTDDASELFNSDFGITISHVLQGGGLWEGGSHVRSVQIPFDFLDAEGANRSLSLANLLERSFTRDGVALVRSEERIQEGRRIAELEFVGTKGDTSNVVYTIALDEGFLPVTIEIRESKTSEKVQRYHVTERRKIDGAGWLPTRCVKVSGAANGEGPAEVAMLEVAEIKIGAPENSEFKTVLPKMYALHLGEMWDSQFTNDVERPIDLAEVERLISVAKRIAADATPAAERKASPTAPPPGATEARKPQEEAAAPTVQSLADSMRIEKAERELLQGTWSLVEQKSNGKSIPSDLKRYDLTFTGNRVVIEWEREVSADLPGSAGVLKRGSHSYWATLNASSSPKELNFVGENFLMQAVYDCTGDNLTMTIAFFGRSEVARPTSLDSSKTSRPINLPHIRWLLKRKTTADSSANDSGPSESFSWDSVGIRLQPCDPSALEAVTGATPPLQGAVAVAEVRPNSPASAAGVRVGDLLVALDKWATNDLDELRIVVRKPDVAVNGRVKFHTVRNGGLQSGYFDLPTP